MDKALLQDYLLKSEMNEAQAAALSQLFGQSATKDDLGLLESRLAADIGRLDSKIMMIESGIRAELKVLEHKVDGKIESLKADLTWRIVGSMVFLATLMTLLDVFID